MECGDRFLFQNVSVNFLSQYSFGNFSHYLKVLLMMLIFNSVTVLRVIFDFRQIENQQLTPLYCVFYSSLHTKNFIVKLIVTDSVLQATVVGS